MANSPAPLKQSELTRYARALQAAGIEAFRVDVKPDGTISIFAGNVDEATGANPCDRLLK